MSDCDTIQNLLEQKLPSDQQPLAEELAHEISSRYRETAAVEARFRVLFNAIHDAAFLVDVGHETILEANDAACAMLGYQKEELIGLGVAEIHPFEMESVRRFTGKVQEYGNWRTSELTCRTHSGHFIPAELSATPLQLNDRDCILMIARDLREHQLALLGIAINKVTHDLRNVLSSMRLLSGTLERVEDPLARHGLSRLLRVVDRASRMCKATLAHGRVEEPPPEFQEFELRDVVEDAAEMAGVIADSGIEWRDEVPAGLRMVADPDQLFRVLLNLFRNSLQALGEGGPSGEVRVTADRQDTGTEIVVTDTGPGLPRELLRHGFDSRGEIGWAPSVGLGLIIARDLVHAHGGTMTPAVPDSGGAEIRIWIPDAGSEQRARRSQNA